VSVKVAHLSSVHPAVDTRIGVKECRTLSQAGYDVVFICQHSGEDVVNGVRIVPVPVRRGRVSRFLFAGWNVFRAALRERAHVYHLHDPELLPIGLLLRMTGAKVIYDVHEDLPRQMLAKPWILRPLRRPLGFVAAKIESLFARAMSGIVTATPQIARRFPADRTVSVRNFAMLDELMLEAATPYQSREAVFAYVGAITETRGVFEMLAAIALVPSQHRAKLGLAGLLSRDTLGDELRRTEGWERTKYHGWQMRPQVARHLDAARAGLLLLHPTDAYLQSYPLKAFEYMGAGLPMIVSDFPFWRELFGDFGCAIFVDPRDARAIAQAMAWVLEHPGEAERMGAKGRAAALASFNWQSEAVKLLSFYHTLLPQSDVGMITARLGDA
jgi:glycosyltransferase involved in cell wall biosynthesis